MRVALAAPRLARLLLGEHPRSPRTDQWGQSKGGGPQHTKLPLTPGGTRRRRAERPSFFVAREDAESRRTTRKTKRRGIMAPRGFVLLLERMFARLPPSLLRIFGGQLHSPAEALAKAGRRAIYSFYSLPQRCMKTLGLAVLASWRLTPLCLHVSASPRAHSFHEAC
jgi:hypothetical protein